MTHRISRSFAGLLFALPLALVSFALAQASSPWQIQEPQALECSECHAEFQAAWEGGAHGQAVTDPAFRSEWEAQGSPPECLGCHTTGYDPTTGEYHAEGVTCAACHNPVPGNHPLAPASMSRAADMCGECHRDTYFEWQASRHGQSDLTCVSCHDPHATGLKADDASTLCASCHGTRVSAFAHSSHAQENLTCTDCHIGEKNSKPGMGRGRRAHTFAVNLETCAKCHQHEIHQPAAATSVATETPAPPASMSSGQPPTASAAPQAVSPVGFALFTGLIGLAFGMVLAPWLERGYRRFAKMDRTGEVRR